jgi:molybdopterin converting factor small subunit
MTLKVSARFVGPLKQVIGEERHIFQLKKGTVKELLDNISEEYPKAEENLKQAGAFIAGRIVRKAELDAPLLKEGDEVSLILPVAGG